MLARLLATTSSSRPSATCRDSPTRRALSIVFVPLARGPFRSPGGTGTGVVPPALPSRGPSSSRRSCLQVLLTGLACRPRAKREKSVKTEGWPKSRAPAAGKFIPPQPSTRQNFPSARPPRNNPLTIPNVTLLRRRGGSRHELFRRRTGQAHGIEAQEGGSREGRGRGSRRGGGAVRPAETKAAAQAD